MIKIEDKHNCCGCSACVQSCPKQCISFDEDEQGFRYPLVNKELCIDCGLCEKVCPCLNQNDVLPPFDLYIYQSSDSEILKNSSSGGAFSSIANIILDKDGVVFGAVFDEKWDVVHKCAKSYNELFAIRGSKYVQSYIGTSFIEVKEYLLAGRFVLFSGTPCQIAALKLFLRKEYDNLLTIDVVCHGVPSPKIWKDYLSSINPLNKKITYVNLREKKRGWSKYSYLIKSEDECLYDDYAANSLFLKGFIDHLYLRPSCHYCPTKQGKSHSDITIADCWGIDKIHPELNNNKGLSAIKLNTNKAKQICKGLVSKCEIIPYEIFVFNNPSYVESAAISKLSDLFWKLYQVNSFDAVRIIDKKKRHNIITRILRKIKRSICR